MTQTPNTEARIPTQTRMITSVHAAEKLVQEIGHLASYGEHYMATALENVLWTGVLEAIASGNAQAGYLAAAALETKKIDFPRTAII